MHPTQRIYVLQRDLFSGITARFHNGLCIEWLKFIFIMNRDFLHSLDNN